MIIEIFFIVGSGDINKKLLIEESGWAVYGPENGYNFPYPRLLRVKTGACDTLKYIHQ